MCKLIERKEYKTKIRYIKMFAAKKRRAYDRRRYNGFPEKE